MKNRVREYRYAMGLTQAQFASKCPISRSYLSQIENGKRNLSAKMMKRIAKLLGQRVEEIFFVYFSGQNTGNYGIQSKQEVMICQNASEGKGTY